jgi:hypothetical protein
VATDIRAELRHEVEAMGAGWAHGAAEVVAGCGIVLTSLPGTPNSTTWCSAPATCCPR